MTKEEERKMYAAAALQGLLTNPKITTEMIKVNNFPVPGKAWCVQAWYADVAFQFADTMIAAAEKPPEDSGLEIIRGEDKSSAKK